jgi:ATP-binding cassette subfamily A (ABC1) protein 3
MNESLRILKLLYYKNMLTRKRQWKISIIGEILIPVGFIMCVWAVRNLSANPPIHFENSTYYENVSKEVMIKDLYANQVNIYFTPNNSFTLTLIEKVVDCLRLNPNNISKYYA